MKELMFIKINHCSDQDMAKVIYIQEIFNAKLISGQRILTKLI